MMNVFVSIHVIEIVNVNANDDDYNVDARVMMTSDVPIESAYFDIYRGPFT